MADTDPQPQPEPTPTPEPQPEPDPELQFTPVTTQAQFDRMTQERIARERAKFADYDELKAKASKFDELDAANKTELEKANERIAQLERQSSEAAQAAQDYLVRLAIVAEAATRHVVDPDAAVALIDRSSITFDDDGSPNNIAAAMDSLLEARPYLVAQSGGTRGSADQGARNGGAGVAQMSREELQRLSAEGKTAEIVKAQQEGRLVDVLGGA